MPSTVLPQKQLFDERYQDKVHQLKLFVELSEGHLYSSLFDEISKEYISFEAYSFEDHSDWTSAQRKFEKVFLENLFHPE